MWNSGIPYTPPSYSYNCTISTMAPRPYLVESFTVNVCSINDTTINLNLTWSPPTLVNGGLDSYEICMGNEPLESNEGISNKSDDCLKHNVCYMHDCLSIINYDYV